MEVSHFKAEPQECPDRLSHDPLLPIEPRQIIANGSKVAAKMPRISTTSDERILSFERNCPMHFLSLFVASAHPLKELLRLFQTSEGQHIAVAHDFFIAVNTKDRLGIFWSHLAENQAFRLQQGKRFLVGTSHILLNTHIVFFCCQYQKVETLPEASMGYIILLRQVPQ